MVIGIDIDNVLCTTTEAVLSVYNEDSGDNLKVSDITSYSIESFVKPQYKKVIKNYFLDKRVWKRIKLTLNCQHWVAELYKRGHKIIFITSTEPENLKKKAGWLQRNFPFIDIRKSLFCCPYKQYMSGIDILIDDAIQNIGNDAYTTILYDYPWNKSYKVDQVKTFRAWDWEEINLLVKNLEKKSQD